MGRPRPLDTKIPRGSHQAVAKTRLPQPVDHHAGGQRVPATDQPAGEFQAVSWLPVRRNVEDRGHRRIHPGTAVEEIAPDMDASLTGMGEFPHHGDGGDDFLEGVARLDGVRQELLRGGESRIWRCAGVRDSPSSSRMSRVRASGNCMSPLFAIFSVAAPPTGV